MKSWSLWNNCRNDLNNHTVGNKNNGYRINNNNNKLTTGNSFKYMTKITRSTDNNTVQTVCKLGKWRLKRFLHQKNPGNLRTLLDLPLINGKTELQLSCCKNSVITEALRTSSKISAAPVEATSTAELTFKVTYAKLYIPIAILSINNNRKLCKIKGRTQYI